MITKLSIARIVGLMMGVWFLSISVAQYVAGAVAQVASVETVGGQVTNLQVSLNTYSACSRPSAGSPSASASCCSCSPGRSRGGCTVSNRRSALRCIAAAVALALAGCAALERQAQAGRRRSAINEDPYPSTYVRYPGVLTVIRHATVFDGEGGRIDNGTVVIADGLIQAIGGPDSPSPPGRSRSTAPASG